MMPNFINAQLLIALLSIKDENYKDAQKALKKCAGGGLQKPKGIRISAGDGSSFKNLRI